MMQSGLGTVKNLTVQKDMTFPSLCILQSPMTASTLGIEERTNPTPPFSPSLVLGHPTKFSGHLAIVLTNGNNTC